MSFIELIYRNTGKNYLQEQYYLKCRITKAHHSMDDNSQNLGPGAHCTASRLLHRLDIFCSQPEALPGSLAALCFLWARLLLPASFRRQGLSESNAQKPFWFSFFFPKSRSHSVLSPGLECALDHTDFGLSCPARGGTCVL